ncbi:MAG: TIGR04211 family SH3 domain-containing protein [Desulfamplus sp.]|nr:TIGR04211 family SH3 domain-containing protein [Desulfamplus sp.]
MKRTHRNCTIYILSIFLYALAAIPSLHAQTGYVSDMLILSLKEGPGRQYNTIKTLRSNTPVEILDTRERFLKIRTQEGDNGWVESQYITHEIPKTIIIQQLTEKIAQLEASSDNPEGTQKKSSESTIDNIDTDLKNDKEASYINKIKSLETALSAQIEKSRLLEAQLSNMDSEQNHEPSLNPISIGDNNIEEEDIDELQKEIPGDEEENGFSIYSIPKTLFSSDDDVLKTAMIKWFCAGAGVLIAGWFIGRSFSGVRRSGGGLLD